MRKLYCGQGVGLGLRLRNTFTITSWEISRLQQHLLTHKDDAVYYSAFLPRHTRSLDGTCPLITFKMLRLPPSANDRKEEEEKKSPKRRKGRANPGLSPRQSFNEEADSVFPEAGRCYCSNSPSSLTDSCSLRV